MKIGKLSFIKIPFGRSSRGNTRNHMIRHKGQHQQQVNGIGENKKMNENEKLVIWDKGIKTKF